MPKQKLGPIQFGGGPPQTNLGRRSKSDSIGPGFPGSVAQVKVV